MAIQTRDIIKSYFESGDTPSAANFIDAYDSIWFKSENIPINQVTYGAQLLTPASGVITWDIAAGGQAKVVLNANCTFTFVNAVAGQTYLLEVYQDATGGRTLTVPTGSCVGYGGSAVLALSSAANKKDIVTIYKGYDGKLNFLVNQNFVVV